MKDYFFLAFNNLRRRRLRSWLTMIGIFIGIAAVVALISLGQGLQGYITGEFEKLGSDKIFVQSKGGFGPPGSVTSESLMLTYKDQKIIEDVRGVEWVAGYIFKQGRTTYKDEININYLTGIKSEDLDYWVETGNIEILEGRSLKDGDKHKVVVGYDHAYGDFWEKELGLGSTILIEGQEFKVVGIVDKIGNPSDDQNINVPKETLKDLLNTGEEESYFMVKTSEGFDPEEIAETIERKLRQFRNEKEDHETFSVLTSDQLLESFSNIFGAIQGVLVGIAAISLLVGGIGIMNTMYMAVIERTKEIGTMKAVGAKNKDILYIFLFESGLLGLVGGAIGVAIGIGLSKGAEYISAAATGTNLLQADASLILILGALLFSFVVGALSGVLPALQAAKLKPAKALRYE